LLEGRDERTPMKIRIRVNEPVCAHQILTLKGRYLTLKGRHLRRSRERYTCNACGARVVRTLKTPVSYVAPDYHATETSPSTPTDSAPASG
jgi:transposase-like protein